MTKISSTESKFDIWNLLDQPTVNNGEKSKQMQDAVPELKGQKIRTDSLELSKEGMTALREKVQSMPGCIDMEEMMQMREILPKLKLNPEDDFYWAMREDMQNSLDAIKQSKGSYTLDDLISIRMDAYTRQYHALQKSYEDGSRDIYICDGSDADGKLQYHKVSKEEDVAFLNQAFDRIADSLGFTAKGCESQLKINELFGGQKAPELSLPDNYDDAVQRKELSASKKISDIDYGYEIQKRAVQQNQNAATGKNTLSTTDKADGYVKAYAELYDEIVKGYENGTREIYVADENGPRKLTRDEELSNLDAAYKKTVDDFVTMESTNQHARRIIGEEMDKISKITSKSALASAYIEEQNTRGKDEIPENLTEKMYGASHDDNVNDYSKYLQGKYSYMNTGTISMQGIPTTVSVSSAFLKKCMNDPEKAKYLMTAQ